MDFRPTSGPPSLLGRETAKTKKGTRRISRISPTKQEPVGTEEFGPRFLPPLSPGIPAGGSPDNGVRAASPAESGTDPLELMGDIFRDADEIFGDTGDGSEGGGEPPDASRAD